MAEAKSAAKPSPVEGHTGDRSFGGSMRKCGTPVWPVAQRRRNKRQREAVWHAAGRRDHSGRTISPTTRLCNCSTETAASRRCGSGAVALAGASASSAYLQWRVRGPPF